MNSYYKNPYDESTEDRIEYIDIRFLAQVTKASLATLISIANREP